MSRVEIDWPGGVHVFALTIGGLRAVQADCDAGPAWILHQIQVGQWRVDHLMSILRHGLTGGGMPDRESRELVRRLFETEPLARFVEPAHRVLLAALVGVEDDPVGEPRGEAPAPTTNASAAG